MGDCCLGVDALRSVGEFKTLDPLQRSVGAKLWAEAAKNMFVGTASALEVRSPAALVCLEISP